MACEIPHSKPFFDEKDEHAVIEVLRDKFVSSGPKSQVFGRKMADIMGRSWGIPTQSGTDALAVALKALKRPEDTTVLLPAYVCCAPLDALALAGLKPKFIDIDRSTLAISIDQVNQDDSSDMVVAAHLFGIPSPFHKIKGKRLIEDCAQTLGIEHDGCRVGSMGDLSVASLYATKIMTAGHGGAVCGDSEDISRFINNLLVHDKQETWEPRWHFLMSDLNAALAISQVEKLGFLVEQRRSLAKYFDAALGVTSTADCMFSRYIVMTEDDLPAEKAIAYFQKHGIDAKKPVYKPAFMYFDYDPNEYPNAAWAHEHIVSIPLYPGMPEQHVELIVKHLEQCPYELRRWPSA